MAVIVDCVKYVERNHPLGHVTIQQRADTSITGDMLDRRLLKARELLSGPDRVETVQAACFASGFRHLSYFSRAYRERFGELPAWTLRNRR